MSQPLYVTLVCIAGIGAGMIYYAIGMMILLRRHRAASHKDRVDLQTLRRHEPSSDDDEANRRFCEALQEIANKIRD